MGRANREGQPKSRKDAAFDKGRETRGWITTVIHESVDQSSYGRLDGRKLKRSRVIVETPWVIPWLGSQVPWMWTRSMGHVEWNGPSGSVSGGG